MENKIIRNKKSDPEITLLINTPLILNNQQIH